MANENAAEFVGGIPENYERGLGSNIFVDYAAEMARRVVAAGPRAVLETAAGTGIVTRAMREELAAEAEIVATDLNRPMLDLAEAKFGADERVSFQIADAQALPFPDARFDAVVCQFGLMFFPDKPRSLREAFRVLKPGGRHLFSVWDSHARNPFARLTHEVVEGFFPDDPPQFYRVPFSLHAIDPIRDMLEDAGFTGIEIAVLPLVKTVTDVAGFARGLVFGNPLFDQIRARGTASPDEVASAVLAALRQAFGEDPARMALQTILYSARRPA